MASASSPKKRTSPSAALARTFTVTDVPGSRSSRHRRRASGGNSTSNSPVGSEKFTKAKRSPVRAEDRSWRRRTTPAMRNASIPSWAWARASASRVTRRRRSTSTMSSSGWPER